MLMSTPASKKHEITRLRDHHRDPLGPGSEIIGTIGTGPGR